MEEHGEVSFSEVRVAASVLDSAPGVVPASEVVVDVLVRHLLERHELSLSSALLEFRLSEGGEEHFHHAREPIARIFTRNLLDGLAEVTSLDISLEPGERDGQILGFDVGQSSPGDESVDPILRAERCSVLVRFQTQMGVVVEARIPHGANKHRAFLLRFRSWEDS